MILPMIGLVLWSVIFTESIPDDFDEEAIRKKLHFAAMHIQYILPEVKERKL